MYHNNVQNVIIRCALGSSSESEILQPKSNVATITTNTTNTTTLSYFPHMPGESSRHYSEQVMRLDEIKKAFSAFVSSSKFTSEIGIEEDTTADQDCNELRGMIDTLENSYADAIPVVCPLRTLSSVLSDECTLSFIVDGNMAVDGGRVDIDLLKIDVEGSELLVLQGLDDLCWSRIRQLVAEVYDIDGRLRAFTDLLSARGFDLINTESSSVEVAGICDNGGDLTGDLSMSKYIRFTPPESKLFFVYASKRRWRY